MVPENNTLFTYLSNETPDCLQRIVQDLCEPVKCDAIASLTSKADKLKAAHGLKIFIDLLADEVTSKKAGECPEPLLKQLPYITWYLTKTLAGIMARDLAR